MENNNPSTHSPSRISGLFKRKQLVLLVVGLVLIGTGAAAMFGNQPKSSSSKETGNPTSSQSDSGSSTGNKDTSSVSTSTTGSDTDSSDSQGQSLGGVHFRSTKSSSTQQTGTNSTGSSSNTDTPTTPPGTPPTDPGPLMGWQITALNVGLAPFGLSCDALPLYTGSLSPAAGTVISQKRVDSSIDLSNGNITIEKSCIQPASGSGMKGIIDTQRCGATDCPTIGDNIIVRDSEIDASKLPASAIAGTCAMVGLATMQRNYIHDMGSGICYYGTGYEYSAVAENNYVTRLRSYGDSHNEAGTIRDLPKNADDTRYIKWINNRLDIADGNISAVLFIQPTWVDIYNIWVIGNLIEGGGWNLYSGKGQTGAHIGNSHAVNNRFISTGWGPAAVDEVETWTEWSQNYLYDASAANGIGAVVQWP